jgi:hypothetical protein
VYGYFEHVQQRGFAGIVEAEEEKFGMLVQKTERRENIPEPSIPQSASDIW